MVDLVERIYVMLEQEARFYLTRDYLAPAYQDKLEPLRDVDDLPTHPTIAASSSSSSGSSCSSGINETWREKICEWSYQVIDHFDFSREVVGISMSYLDRYLSTRSVNKKMFQLAAMTSLFIAIKLYEPGRLSIPSMIELSRGYFTVEQMAAMEISILRALKWNMHPPTAYCFAKHVLFLLPSTSIPMEVRHDIWELTRFLTELSVIDYFFVVHKPSTVALAALLNSMSEMQSISQEILGEFITEITKISGLDPSSQDVVDCRNRLNLLYAQGGYTRPTTTETRIDTVSPVCVSYGCNPHVRIVSPETSTKDTQPSRDQSSQNSSRTVS